MSQSLTKLYVHIVFHIKGNTTPLREKESQQLHSYIAGILKSHDSIPVQINSTDNHIHILCVLSKNIALATLVQQIKAGSSGWIKTLQASRSALPSMTEQYNTFETRKSTTKRWILKKKSSCSSKNIKSNTMKDMYGWTIKYVSCLRHYCTIDQHTRGSVTLHPGLKSSHVRKI